MGTYNPGNPHNAGKTFNDNLTSSFLKDYPVTKAGYFGKAGNSTSIREIQSADAYTTAQDFADRISEGSVSTKNITHGWVATLADGTRITYRVVTSSEGSPAVDINIEKGSYKGKVKTQKIHFVTEKIRKEREEMIRSISHDIRTPLTSILSYSEYMQKKEDWSKEEIKSYMELMQGKAEQIKSLTNQLIGKKERKLEFIDNGKILIEQLVMEWEELLEDRFPCEVIWNECNNFSGIFDISELRRIFDNLSSNVEKYGDPKQSVKLEVITGEDKLVLIQENGVRTEGELEVESNKIGLNNIRQIVGMYDGEVEVTKSEKEFRIQMIIPVKKVL